MAEKQRHKLPKQSFEVVKSALVDQFWQMLDALLTNIQRFVMQFPHSISASILSRTLIIHALLTSALNHCTNAETHKESPNALRG